MIAHRNRRTVAFGGLVAGLLLVGGSVAAQEDMDARWLPWLGCWESADGEGDAAMLCVRPGTGEAVEFLSMAGDVVRTQDTYIADGSHREIARDGCEGWESAEFSTDGRRVYLRSEQVCEGGGRRDASGLLAWVSRTEWVEVRAVSMGRESVPLVRRYQLADGERVQAAGLEGLVEGSRPALIMARAFAAVPPTVEEVMEAVARVDSKAVEVWVAESGTPFALSAEKLVAMADAGVPARVTDLMVAVSYPDEFNVGYGAGAGVADEYQEGYGPPRYIYPMYFDPFYYSPYYSSQWGYWGGYGWYSGYRPPVIVVTPKEPRPHGRVVKGFGYRKGSTSGSQSSSGGSSSVGSRGSSGASGAPGARSGSSSSGRASTGRTAKRRGGS